MTATWIEILRTECERIDPHTRKPVGQAAVARRMGVSPSLVNQVLQGRYKGDLDRLEAIVNSVFRGVKVTCPILDEIPLHECLENQARDFVPTNPNRARLYRACRSGCPHSKLPQEY